MRYSEFLTEGQTQVLTVEGWEHWQNGPNDFHHDLDNLEDDIEYAGGLPKYIMLANRWIASLPNPLPIYRGLHVPDPEAWIRDHARGVGRDLGVSWTTHFEIAINENGPDGGYGRAMTGPTNIVLVGEVQPDAVDWYCTAAMHTVDREEPEIRLMRKGTVRIMEVALLDLSRPTGQSGRHADLADAFGERGADYDHNHISRTIALNLTLQA